MTWKRPDADNPPTQSPMPPAPQPSVMRSQPPSPREQALIGPSIVIKGSLSGDEDLFVQGRVEGKIELAEHSVTIGANGRIKADVHGRTIVVMGEVEGNLYGSDQIVLRQSSSVLGNLAAPRVSLEDGSNFKGSIDMTSKPKAKSKTSDVDLAPAKPPSDSEL